jgi:hypothetical protein
MAKPPLAGEVTSNSNIREYEPQYLMNDRTDVLEHITIV